MGTWLVVSQPTGKPFLRYIVFCDQVFVLNEHRNFQNEILGTQLTVQLFNFAIDHSSPIKKSLSIVFAFLLMGLPFIVVICPMMQNVPYFFDCKSFTVSVNYFVLLMAFLIFLQMSKTLFENDFTTHSIRRSAARWAARCGADDSTIKRAGRWYVRCNIYNLKDSESVKIYAKTGIQTFFATMIFFVVNFIRVLQ